MPVAYTSCVRVSRVRLDVHLGFGDEERSVKQAIEVDVAFYFPALTEASYTDKGDFVCYDKISRAFKQLCEERQFNLIEYLGKELYNVARSSTPPEVKITLRLNKCKILLPFVLGGASFSYTDLPPFSWTPPD